MEAFVASNESQWDVITRVINECDYYVLIIGGRYGSITSDGISYTEREYNYAKKLSIPVLAFAHADPDLIAAGKTEKDEEGRKRLEAFRARVMAEHPIRTWTSAKELGALVSRSLTREIKINPRPGWIRNDGTSPIALLEQVNRLTQENDRLREVASRGSVGDEVDPELENGEDEIELEGTRTTYVQGDGNIRAIWKAAVSWDDIFRDVGPTLINESTDAVIKAVLARFHVFAPLEAGQRGWSDPAIAPETFNDVIIQLRALGLMDKGEKKRGVNDRNSYWSITDRGDRYLISLLARRKTDQSNDPNKAR
jgi:hypothetical protein